MDPDAPLPRVSVIIPTYNRSAMVCGAIDSVLDQTLEDFEVLVIDDGSTDDTVQVVRDRYTGNPRITCLRKENGGPADARAHGLQHARADLLALLDSDDRYLPRFLESQAAFLEAHPEADMALCDARYEGDWGFAWDTVFSGPHWITPDSTDAMAQFAWGLPSTTMMRTAAARRIGFASEFHWSEDTDFLWRFHIAGLRVAQNPEVLTRYCRHGGQAGSAQRIDDRDHWMELHLEMLAIYYPHATRSRDLACDIHRLLAEHHLRKSDRRSARSHYWQWWCRKPTSSKALRGVLRTSLPGRRA